MKKNQWTLRIILYAIGVLVLALGVTLNLKTGLGVSPIITVPFSVAAIGSWNVGNITLLFYSLLTILQLIIRGKDRRWTDLLQIPFSIVFTRLMNLFSTVLDLQPQHLWQQFVILFFAIVCTGVGAAMSVNMKIIANPCDAFVNMAGELSGKGMGFAKNIFDLANIIIAFFIGLLSGHFLAGIGIGTVIAVLGLGRVVALFNKLFKEKTTQAAGISNK